MKRQLFPLMVILMTGMTLLSGVLQGRMSHRWGPPPDTVSAASKLKQLPYRFGDWRLLSSDDVGKVALDMLQCVGHVARRYENQKTGEVVSVMLLLGPTGPISVHTPEVCFSSRNYLSRGERQRVAIRGAAGSTNEFWALDYKTESLGGDSLRVYYGWSTGGRWSAPNDARFTFVGQPYLYKLQLSSLLPPPATPSTPDPCQKFLQDFVPVAEEYLLESSVK
jgi:hypothetical protein